MNRKTGWNFSYPLSLVLYYIIYYFQFFLYKYKIDWVSSSCLLILCVRTLTWRSLPCNWWCTSEVACRFLWGPWLGSLLLLKLKAQIHLMMWRWKLKIMKEFPKLTTIDICRTEVGGWSYSSRVQYSERVNSSFGFEVCKVFMRF